MALFLGTLTIPARSSAPSAGPAGSLYYNTTDGGVYKSNGSAWSAVAGAGAGVSVSDTAPGSPAAGELWFESDTGALYIYYDSTWVEIGTAGEGSGFAVDADVVHLAGAETITGDKTFTGDVYFGVDSSLTGENYLYLAADGSESTVNLSSSGGNGSVLMMSSSRGTVASRSNLAADDPIWKIWGLQYVGGGWQGSGQITMTSVDGAGATKLDFSTVDAGGLLKHALVLDEEQKAVFDGTIVAPAATTSLAPLRIPHGTAPSSPTNGDVWTTSAGLYARINGVTVGPLGAGGGSSPDIALQWFNA